MLDLDNIFDSDRRHAEAMRRAGMYLGTATATPPASQARAVQPPREPPGDADTPVVLRLSAADRVAIAFNPSEPTQRTIGGVESQHGLHMRLNATDVAATWPKIPAGTPSPVRDLCEPHEGWTPGAWMGRLRQLAAAADVANPERAGELRQAAALFDDFQSTAFDS